LSRLYGGLVVAAHVRDGVTTIDPTAEGSNAAAIEAANAALVEGPITTGTIYLPAYDPNGEQFSIERQVLIGSRSTPASVSLRAPTTADAVDVSGDEPAVTGAITTEIDDGSAVFVWASATDSGGRAARDVVFGGHYSLGDNDVSLLRMQNINTFHVAPTIRHFTGSGIILDGVANGTIGGVYHPYDPTAVVIDSRSGHQQDDSDVSILPNTETESQYAEFLTDKNGGILRRPRIAGHFEGAQGEAHVYIENKSQIIVTDAARIAYAGGGADGTTHGVKYAGSGWLLVLGGSFSHLAGDALRVEGPDVGWLHVSQSLATNPWNIDGNDVTIEAPPAALSLVPAADSRPNPVSYPSDTDTLRAMPTEPI
jgi:hypothetical protein